MNMQFGRADFRFLIYNSKIQILSLQRHLYFWISNNIWQVLTFVLNLKCYGKLIVLFFEYFLRIFSENWISWMIVQKTFSRKISAITGQKNVSKNLIFLTQKHKKNFIFYVYCKIKAMSCFSMSALLTFDPPTPLDFSSAHFISPKISNTFFAV